MVTSTFDFQVYHILMKWQIQEVTVIRQNGKYT